MKFKMSYSWNVRKQFFGALDFVHKLVGFIQGNKEIVVKSAARVGCDADRKINADELLINRAGERFRSRDESVHAEPFLAPDAKERAHLASATALGKAASPMSWCSEWQDLLAALEPL